MGISWCHGSTRTNSTYRQSLSYFNSGFGQPAWRLPIRACWNWSVLLWSFAPRVSANLPPGKTESVKALGVQLGRFVLVFCCDETFDFQAMGRIFVGLCQVGAWGCFDEFNRLEERILSAVSQQVQSIQQGLAQLVKNPNTEIELVGKHLRINKNIGTMLVLGMPKADAYTRTRNIHHHQSKLCWSFTTPPQSDQAFPTVSWCCGPVNTLLICPLEWL